MRYEGHVDLPDLLPSAEIVISSANWLVITPLRILLIIVLALIARWLAHRMIRRLIRRTTSGDTPLLLRPLRERAPALAAATGLLSERRRQRAETIGSLLRNVASILIFSITVLLVLGELGVNLAPLLASAGIAGVAIGFGAQYLVRDVISGLFMIIEDQYGVGDLVDLGEASGTVEAVGLRVTTVRDIRGAVWYVRNGEVIRVGNMSQGWARVVLDVPIGLGTPVDDATEAIRNAATELAEDPAVSGQVVEPPEVWGVEDMTLEGPVVRVVVRTLADDQWEVARQLRRRVVDALDRSGINAQLAGARIYVRPTPGEDRTAGQQDPPAGSG
ncbi:MAG: mechanosensitive ion channel family protein [Micromonosporaceae bacterium]